jgi:predicted enzyme related to lactoylglutathione lyase
MPQIDKHPTGTFCWVELATNDQNAAKAFYQSLFGWEVVDMPMGPNDFYSMFKLQGGDVGAAYTLRPDQREHGVPPNWMLYVAVDSADQAAKRAAELGGQILAPPFDVFDVGRMAVIQDPTGPVFCVWQAKSHQGTRTVGEMGTLCWADLNSRDEPAAQKFYGGLFGWTFERDDKDPKGDYIHIKNGNEFIGGIPSWIHRSPETPAHWLPYFEVADCDKTTALAKSQGGNILYGPMSLEGVGRFVILADPQGAAFALYQAEHK